MKIAKICCDGRGRARKAELFTPIPLVDEESLRHDETGYSYNSGSFMVMEAMMWNKALVTTRRLHKLPPPGAVVDMLVRECMYMSRLRHPNILLMVAMCRTSNPDNVVLLYERVYWGSLFQFLYQKYERMAVWEMCVLMRQICSAVSYLHDNDLLHTAINSHSIHVVSQNLAKLGNFEYMVENNKKRGLQTMSMLTPSQHISYLFHWTAPEILAEKPISEMTDLYSLCAVVWEILHGSIPWVGLNVEEIRCKMLMQKKHLQIEESFLEPPFNVILQQGLSMYPSCRKITVADLQDLLTNIITNRDQINVSLQNISPKKRTKISMSEPKLKSHPQRKSVSEQSLRVSFDDRDALVYEPSIKSSTPARKVQSARPAKSDSPEVPPRRRLTKPSPVAVPQPQDIIQVSISSIEGSQKETSPTAFARSLSNGSRVQRKKQAPNLKPWISSDHSLSVNESTLSPSAINLGLDTPDTAFPFSDENSSAVRRSLFQGPQPYKPSNSSISGMTKVSFRPTAIKDQHQSSSESSSLTQMPQLTSSSLSNGINISNHLNSTPSDSPVVFSRHVTGFSRPLLSSNSAFRLSKTLCGYTKLNLYDPSIRRGNSPNLRPSQSDMVQTQKKEEVPPMHKSADELDLDARHHAMVGNFHDSQKKCGTTKSTRSEEFESPPGSPYLVRVTSNRKLGSCEKTPRRAYGTPSSQQSSRCDGSTDKRMVKEQDSLIRGLQFRIGSNQGQQPPFKSYPFKIESPCKSKEFKGSKNVLKMKYFFEKKAEDEIEEILRNQSCTESPSFVENEGYVRTPTGWMKTGQTVERVEKFGTPGTQPVAVTSSEGFTEVKAGISSSSVDQGIQTELPYDEIHSNSSESNLKDSWNELSCVQKRIHNFQEIANKKKERADKLEVFFNKSSSKQAGSTTSTPQIAGCKHNIQGDYQCSPILRQERALYSLSPKCSTERSLRHMLDEQSAQEEIDKFEKARRARNARINQLREKYTQLEVDVETKKSNSDTVISSEYNDRPLKSDARQEFELEMDNQHPITDSSSKEISDLKEKLTECMRGGGEDSYFDDVLHPNVKERHMRLQTTMALDQSSLLDNEVFDIGSAAADDTNYLAENNPNLTLEGLSLKKERDADLREPIEGRLERRDYVREEGATKKDIQPKIPQVGEGDIMADVDEKLLNQNNNASTGLMEELHCDINNQGKLEANSCTVEVIHCDELESEQATGRFAMFPIFRSEFKFDKECQTEDVQDAIDDQIDVVDNIALNRNNNATMGFLEHRLYCNVISELEELSQTQIEDENCNARDLLRHGYTPDILDASGHSSKGCEQLTHVNTDSKDSGARIEEEDAINQVSETEW